MAEKCCNKLRFATYNCKGNGADRFEYMKCILANCDFLLVQEHWLLQNDIKPKFEKHLNNINVTGVSGMDSTKLLCGRPYGGCSIVWHKNLRSRDGTRTMSKNGHRHLKCPAVLKYKNFSKLHFVVYR